MTEDAICGVDGPRNGDRKEVAKPRVQPVKGGSNGRVEQRPAAALREMELRARRFERP